MKHPLILVLLAVIAIGSCDREPDPVSPPVVEPKGTLWGYLDLRSECLPHPEDLAGVTVTVDGLNVHGTSNADGLWSIDSVPAGTHTLIFAKEKYHTRKFRYVGFAGRGRMFVDGDRPTNSMTFGNRIHLYAATAATVELDQPRVTSSSGEYRTCAVTGHVATPTGCTAVALYLDLDPGSRRRRDIESTPLEHLRPNGEVRDANGDFEITNVFVRVGDTLTMVAAAGVLFPNPVYDPDLDRILSFAPGSRSNVVTWIVR